MKKTKSTTPWLDNYDHHVPPHLEYPQVTIVELFLDAVNQTPERIFLIHRGKKYNYSEVYQQVISLANQLHLDGIRKGDRVAMLLPNIPEFITAYYAILLCGGIVVALNPSYKGYELEYLLKDASPKMIVCLPQHLEVLENINIYTTFVKIIVINQRDAEDQRAHHRNPEFAVNKKVADKVILYDDILRNRKGTIAESFPAISGSDAAIFQYSGGTTGSPKAAIGMHQNIVCNAVQFAVWCNLIPNEEVILAAIPLYHVYGMVLAMNLGVYIGASLVLIDDPRDIESLLKSLKTYQVTFFPGVPSIYYAINQNPRLINGEIHLESIKACISGSAPLHPSIKQEFEHLTQARLMEGYGLSEAPTATHCNPLLGINKAGSIGMPLPDVVCKIVDLETGEKELGINEVGELIIKGPQVMLGYHNRDEENELTLKDGWLFTGDVARCDEDGYYFIVDRKKSLIKVNGLQVWPNEVETIIASHPLIKESAVGGVPDLAHGENVIAWVVVKNGEVVSSEEIQNWCRQFLSGYKVPSEVMFVENLPRTGVGKILRRELIANYLKNETRG